jgi:hypothetical protein
MQLSRLAQPYVLADVLGLSLTILGALINTRGAIIEGEDAKRVAHTAGDHNEHLENAVETQSRSARIGFRLIAAGACLQIVATVFQAMA